MYLIREVMHCKPGKVRPLLEGFRAISASLQDLGHAPMRLLTDVSGGPFWTLVAETTVERIEDFFALEEELMQKAAVREAMAGYHDFVQSGGREIYRIES